MNTCVKVTRSPFGVTSFSESVCDVFDPDVLTVSCTDPDFDRKYGPLEVFKAGTWLEYQVLDARGYPVEAGLSTLGQQQQDAWRQRRAS